MLRCEWVNVVGYDDASRRAILDTTWRDFHGFGLATGPKAIISKHIVGDPDMVIAQICVSC
jgi:hypothetical protein